eukprot:TRINITY_DN30797_c0_g2_i1.p1 TRINITY_DN30797_c0_g2~~TRINITY_DN30797_c0_g2_i1.p1  ORF type:complete len:345 (+),score=58.96 TRINITY_DN30797_c0_g2_i1:633-1667(+)
MKASLWAISQGAGAALATVLFKLVRSHMLNPSLEGLPSLLTAEFYGTFMLSLTACLNKMDDSQATSLSDAACLLCMRYSLADVSGGHFNPAVSLAAIVAGTQDMYPLKWTAYTVVQAGASLSAGNFAIMFRGSHGSLQAVELAPAEYGMAAALASELLFTLALVVVVLSEARRREESPTFASSFAVASCVTAAGIASGKISGGTLNPAIAIAISNCSSSSFADSMFMLALWSGAEMLGGLVASTIFLVASKMQSGSQRSCALQTGDLEHAVLDTMDPAPSTHDVSVQCTICITEEEEVKPSPTTEEESMSTSILPKPQTMAPSLLAFPWALTDRHAARCWCCRR